MVKRLNRNVLVIILISILVGCDKEEVEIDRPTIEAPATFELHKIEIGDVEVYTKNGKVTGDKAKHLGGSKYLFSTMVANILKVEFRDQDTVQVHSEFKPDPNIVERYIHKFTATYQKQSIRLYPIKPIPALVLDPSAAGGSRLEKDFKKLEELRKYTILQLNDSILKIDRYQEVFKRPKGNTNNFLFLTVNTVDDKDLYTKFTDTDTLWIRKQTFHLKKVRG